VCVLVVSSRLTPEPLVETLHAQSLHPCGNRRCLAQRVVLVNHRKHASRRLASCDRLCHRATVKIFLKAPRKAAHGDEAYRLDGTRLLESRGVTPAAATSPPPPVAEFDGKCARHLWREGGDEQLNGPHQDDSDCAQRRYDECAEYAREVPSHAHAARSHGGRRVSVVVVAADVDRHGVRRAIRARDEHALARHLRVSITRAYYYYEPKR